MKNNIIIILLCVIFLMLGTLLGICIYNKYDTNDKNQKNEIVEEKELTTSELLKSLLGEWGTCENSSCRGIIIGKNEKDEYIFTPYIMWSDGFAGGTIKKVKKQEKDVYNISVYYAGFENEEASAPEETIEYKINISEISSNIIYVDDTKYQKITTDRETFFNSIK